MWRSLYITDIKSPTIVAVKAIREALRVASGSGTAFEASAIARQFRERGIAPLGSFNLEETEHDALIAALAANGVKAEVLSLSSANLRAERHALAKEGPAVPASASEAEAISEEGWKIALVLLNQAGGNFIQAAVNAHTLGTASPATAHVHAEARRGLCAAFPGLKAGLDAAGIK
jgi:hypothetical protein